MNGCSRRDELVSAILEGAFESPLWDNFLRILRTQTGADHATLIFRPPGKSPGEAMHLYSGPLRPNSIEHVYNQYLYSLDVLSAFEMAEDRVYSFDDMYRPLRAEHQDFFDKIVVPSGVSAARVIRVVEKSGVNAWLTISRRGEDFGPSDDALLMDLAPVLRGALRNYVALERERFMAAITGDAMRRLYFAWMILDEHGNVLEYDPEVEKVFAQTGVLSKGPGGCLVISHLALERQVYSAVKELAANSQAKPRVFTLSWDPWLDLLLMPAAQKRLSISPRAAVVAYLHGDSWRASDRCDQLVQLFGLSKGEARLALSLSRGMTIEEAAESFQLKVNTARKYSKIIYAKTGARGLPDLVRIVMRSVIAIAPER